MVGKGEVHGLGTGGADRWILHRFERFHEGGVPEVGFAFVTIDAIQEGRDFKKLETGVHEVEVLYFLLRGHIETIGEVYLFRNAGDVLVELGVEVGEGPAELIKFGSGAVDFNAIEFGKS